MSSATGEITLRARAHQPAATWRFRMVLLFAILVAFALVFILPFYWTITTSLKSADEIYIFPPEWLPPVPRWVNYVEVWSVVPYARFVENTLVVAVLGVIGQVGTATLVAYGFARFRFPGRDLLFLITLGTLILPAEVLLVPTFLLFKYLGWLNTLAPLIVPHWFGGGAFFIFLLRQFFLTLPRDFDDAAKVDGAGPLRILWSVLGPLSKPALATAAILSFLARWNEFLQPVIYLNSPDRFTLAVGITYFQEQGSLGGKPLTHLLMAAAL
ncbi:MAG TPA: carbohydrate ABC transporter permease, partial [Chloroflexota bacterium]|nr:carbohydrate ABC transporter permease [Chloroflexota bacterium]